MLPDLEEKRKIWEGGLLRKGSKVLSIGCPLVGRNEISMETGKAERQTQERESRGKSEHVLVVCGESDPRVEKGRARFSNDHKKGK